MALKEFFYLQRNDRKVFLALLFFAAVFVALLLYIGGGKNNTGPVAADTTRSKSEKVSLQKARQHTTTYYDTGHGVAELFPFDPNTADSTTLLRLGLQPWQVRNIYKYRARGGIYRKPADFARVYGLTAGQYRRMQPYIRISPDFLPAADVYATGTVAMPARRDSVPPRVKLRPGEYVVLNTADTTQLKKVPGIGSGWARVIDSYGKRLGGYCSVEQLKEIEGLPLDVLGYFKISSPHIQKLHVNKLSISQMRRHPYINFYQARAIADYRRLHGPLSDIDQLGLLDSFSPQAIQRLKPYVSFEK